MKSGFEQVTVAQLCDQIVEIFFEAGGINLVTFEDRSFDCFRAFTFFEKKDNFRCNWVSRKRISSGRVEDEPGIARSDVFLDLHKCRVYSPGNFSSSADLIYNPYDVIPRQSLTLFLKIVLNG